MMSLLQRMPFQRWLPNGIALQLFAMSALAGPIPIELGLGTRVDSASTPRAPHASHSASAASSPNSIEPSGAVEAFSPASDLAVEIIKEAQADNQQADSGRSAVVGTDATKVTARNRAGNGHDEFNLRELGKSAVEWLRMRFGNESSDQKTERSSHPYLSDDHLARESIDNTAKVPTGATRKAASENPVQPMSVHQDENPVRIVIEVARELLLHPLSWLVVALVVIGGIVVKKIDRRPTN